jgi:tetratricopeptide (TPR) repeat protein
LRAHIKKGETDLALSDCNQAIQLDPKNAMAYHNRAAGYSAKGDCDRTIGDLDQVIQLDPKNAMALRQPLRGAFQQGRNRSSTERLQSSNPTRSEKWRKQNAIDVGGLDIRRRDEQTT